MGASDGILMLAQKQKQSQKNRFFKIRWGGVRYMNYRIVYYVGTNLICWIILDIIYRNFKKYLPKETLARTEVLCMIFWAMVACAADIVAGVFRGYVFAGSRALLITANLCYLVALVLVAFFWRNSRRNARGLYRNGQSCIVCCAWDRWCCFWSAQ